MHTDRTAGIKFDSKEAAAHADQGDFLCAAAYL